MTKQTVVRLSLRDQIKSILIDRMIAGDLVPGDRIKELTIAQEFGTSQAPVREAIRCLETLGYVEHIPHVGATVRTFHKIEIEEAYQVREALEVHSVSLINGNVEKLVDELNGYLDQMHHAAFQGNIRMFTQADNLFHRSIVAFSSNETMLSIWESLKMQLQVIATLVEASMPLDKIYELHPPIVKALENEGHPRAALLLKGHYKAVSEYWESIK